MSVNESYGRSFEGPIIVIMSLAIILSIAGVIWLNKAYSLEPECNPSLYTYCEEQAASTHH